MRDGADSAGMGPAPADLLAPLRTRWRLTADGAAFATPSSVLQSVRMHGQPAFLKLATIGEEAAGGRVMRWWDGRGAALVLAAEGDALVLARATGHADLAALAASGPDGDRAATRVLCRAALRLHAVDDRPRPDGLVSLQRWFAELFEHAEAHPHAHGGMFALASAAATALLADPQGDVVLHGDLHHGNVLDFGGAAGAGSPHWLAIDPKHLHGDPAFDFANILCNPDAAVALAPGRFDRAVAVIEEQTGIERPRMLRWALAWAGLSAAWSERAGGDPSIATAVGTLAARALAIP